MYPRVIERYPVLQFDPAKNARPFSPPTAAPINAIAPSARQAHRLALMGADIHKRADAETP